ncbi:GNAT family N-acetyltransferase [Taibaiella koreensis]|uniref:GNAT family N-acetyltransferase n=1 Tax=Taibaiella koreensis TaxID=1268548 RepID=UPI000E59E9BF|nr:GNAT family N-acetyltransferase [Taibaiella koreensis]
MLIVPLQPEDLDQVANLTPEGWDNLVPHFTFNLQAPFCFPLKALLDGEIAGVGNVICNAGTAWLAQIVVHPSFRNRGVGKAITSALLEQVDRRRFPTILLDATDMGYPVYRSLGFETISRHVHFSGSLLPEHTTSAIVPYEPAYRIEVLQLDRRATGENREAILEPYLEQAYIYRDGDKVSGVFFPTLYRGLVVVENVTAGLTLLQMRLGSKAHAMLPEENTVALAALEEWGFKEQRRSRRMRLGPAVPWQPRMIFNVTGGALG